jgi:sec-independent protein translocase protein TatA
MIMGNIGTGELIIALLVVVMLFGAKRLPEVARGLGQSLKIFKTEISRPSADVVTAETTRRTGRTEPPVR